MIRRAWDRLFDALLEYALQHKRGARSTLAVSLAFAIAGFACWVQQLLK